MAADDHLCRLTNRRIPVPGRCLDRRLHGRILEHGERDDRPSPDLRRSGSDEVEQRHQCRIIPDRSESRDGGFPSRPVTVVRRQTDEPRNGRSIALLPVRRCDCLDDPRIIILATTHQGIVAPFAGAAESLGGHRSDRAVLVIGDDAAEFRGRIDDETRGDACRDGKSADRGILVAEKRHRTVEQPDQCLAIGTPGCVKSDGDPLSPTQRHPANVPSSRSVPAP